jgi:glycosyltransferase involved in cell wall biosynthesis
MARADISITFVLLAYNEEASIADAIADCRAFALATVREHEIIVVDDGSRDRTSEVANTASEGDVRVIVHPHNQGMGASMRDGYVAATMDYVAHLPGDRQVRAEALAPLIPLCAHDTVGLTVFSNPPSGRARVIMSAVFRQLTRRVGRMRVNFAGTYLFHRDWLERIEVGRADSDTFLFSFQLLELFRRAGARFETRRVRTYPREQGASREATLSRIANMFAEIARARMR